MLRELAAISEELERQDDPWARLTPEAVDEALEMIAELGALPALGWWRERLPRPAWYSSHGGPPAPGISFRPWKRWELVAAAVALSEEQVDRETAERVLAQLAVDHGLDVDDLVDAYVALDPRSP
jgi:hypothetical protein